MVHTQLRQGDEGREPPKELFSCCRNEMWIRKHNKQSHTLSPTRALTLLGLVLILEAKRLSPIYPKEILRDVGEEGWKRVCMAIRKRRVKEITALPWK